MTTTIMQWLERLHQDCPSQKDTPDVVSLDSRDEDRVPPHRPIGAVYKHRDAHACTLIVEPNPQDPEHPTVTHEYFAGRYNARKSLNAWADARRRS